MLGIDPSMMVHQLKMDLMHEPVKQKKQSFAPECQKAIADKVDKLLDAGFIRKTTYPKWITNPIPVKKANGK